jgi:Family of unknown function (DUF5305)
LINRIKTVPVIIAIILVIVGIGGTVKGFTSTTTTTTQQPVTLLNYEQDGSFDYQATMAPSDFYGSNQPTIPSSPNIPLQDISSLMMTYQYSSPENQVQVEIDAVLVSAENWQKTVTLVPQETEKGNFSVSFPIDLNSLKTNTQAVEKELGDIGYSPVNINVVATVTGADAVFTHTLAITQSQTFMMIGNTLVQTEGESTGIFSYNVALTDNALYGATTISSPSVTINPPLVLGTADTVLINLVNSLDFTYTYNTTSDQPLSQPVETVVVNATLANPGHWSKTFVLVPSIQENGNFALNFPVDLAQYSALYNNIQRETGVPGTVHQLTLEADVELKAQTGAGSIDKTFSDSIITDLAGGVLTWTGDLQQSQKGSIASTTNVQTAAKIIGIQVALFRAISIVILVIGLVLLALLFLVPAKKVDERAILKQKALETERKYKNLIISVNKLPEQIIAEGILTVDSLDELIKVAQALLKPINHVVDDTHDIYWITDGVTCYQYKVVRESSSGTKGTDGS